MKLPLYHYGDKRVVIWFKEASERQMLGGYSEEVWGLFSILKDSGELSGFKSRTVNSWEFTEEFERQPEEVDVGWNRIAPKSEELPDVIDVIECYGN